MAEPSKVLHLRNVGPEVTEADLIHLAASFGQVTRVVLLRSKNQALIQLQDLPAAVNMLQYYSGVQPTIRGRNLYMQFSGHKELTTPASGSSQAPLSQRIEQEPQPNRILLVTIHNPLYPITVDVLHQVFSPHGFVEKIVIFSKPAGLQALLQYQTQTSATTARNMLQGRNIYDGCCTLDIQFSNLPELQVNYNSDRTRDYTNSSLPSEQAGRGQLSTGRSQNIVSSLFGDGGNVFSMHGQRPGFHQSGGHGHMGMQFVPNMGMGLQSPGALGIQLPPGISGTNDRRVVLASNLNVEKVDPDKLFNLFSNYGNVVRIKMLHNKPDHALIEMADGLHAEMAVTFLKGVMLFGKRMDVNYSKHPIINPSPDARDYSTSPYNRFTRNAAKNYRHCCPPTRMLHCSSLPADVTDKDMIELLSDFGHVVGARVTDNNGKKQALVQFASEDEAVEALVCKHATDVKGSIMRLAFSKLTAL